MIKYGYIHKSYNRGAIVSHKNTAGLWIPKAAVSTVFGKLEGRGKHQFKIPKLKRVERPKPDKLYLWVRLGYFSNTFYFRVAPGDVPEEHLNRVCWVACRTDGIPFFRGIRNKTWKAYAIPKIEYIKQ